MKITVDSVKKIFSDGTHNAFSGLCVHKGRYYLVFRSGKGHVSDYAVITVLVSEDTKSWRRLAVISEGEKRDLRDPKIISFNGRLLVYAAIRDIGLEGRESIVYEMKENGSFQAHSISGLPPRYWLWALASHQDKIYGTAYIHTKAEGFAVRLFNSEDGFKWSEICKFPVSGNETFIDFDIEGNLYGIIRMEAPPFHPYFVRFPAPVSDKHTISVLPTVFQGPFIKRLEGGCLLVGRRWDKLDGARRVDMLWLDDSGQLGYIATLPSGGDCSYASYAQTGPKNAIICYYSTHEHLSSGSETGDIYMARLSLGLS